MIRLENLNKHYGQLHAVNELCLEVPSGELFCFLGPNGAGKTTSIKMMTGLVKPDTGRIILADIDAAKEPVKARSQVGYIPDMPFIYERLTPMEFLLFTGDLYQMSREDVREKAPRMLEIFGMTDRAHTLNRDLSHGMRQRVIYAATLMHEPKVLLVDEPFIGLDPHSIRLIKDLLREHTRRGMTVLMTTHILAIAEEIGDRIGIIDHGELVACGTLDELNTATPGMNRLEDLFLELTLH
ncbi:ABC transporter ATP-binding protein [Kiritimatiellota bacterium B12222]|nr:ABC transporter ATP-binding protein [Kiritimatiellota bacterium B12222]